MEFKIDDRLIGPYHKPLVIAEIGINHGGNINIAKQMIDSAKRSGAEVVKFQTHIVEDEMTADAKNTIPGNTTENIYDIMASCSFNKDQDYEIKEYVESQGMIYMSSAFSRAAALRLNEMNVKAIKIGSGECNNYPLLELVASFRRPTILSTGMNSIPSIRKAVTIFQKYNCPLALLHTTNLYPTYPDEVRLGAMVEMHQEFPNLVFGLSDHTLNNLACMSAVALGASILERHFTDHKYRKGPDIVCSMDEAECFELIRNVGEIHKMLGGKKEPLLREQVTMDFAFASVCSIAEIKKGEKFTLENLWVKRPGTGKYLADKFDEILGKIALRDIPNDEQLKEGDF